MTWAADRPGTTARGYGAEHQQQRAQWQLVIDERGCPCARGCGTVIVAGMRWHLDHTDDRSGYLGPSCVRCNLVAAGRAGRARRPKLKRERGKPLGLID